jgi:hypothetical protein
LAKLLVVLMMAEGSISSAAACPHHISLRDMFCRPSEKDRKVGSVAASMV